MQSSLVFRQNLSICAPITAVGGGVCVVRLSGHESCAIIKKACPFLVNKKLESHKVYHGFFCGVSEQKLDEVLVTYFKQGKSFTGEHSFEISFHSSPYIVNKALEILVNFGAVLAEKGEFTFRAFLNSRIDLTQAEGVLGVLQSCSEQHRRAALSLMEGSFSKELHKIEADLLQCISHLEAQIDYNEEDLSILSFKDLESICQNIIKKINIWTNAFQATSSLNSFRVGIYGHVNVGKSTLLNFLLKQDKAIVTDRPGTTRDLVEGQCFVGDFLVNFIDTAGLRVTEDPVEKKGIIKALNLTDHLDLIIYVVDVNAPYLDQAFLDSLSLRENIIVLANKIDLLKNSKPDFTYDFKTSFQTGYGVNKFLKALEEKLTQKTSKIFDEFLIKERHFHLLKQAQSNIIQGKRLLKETASPEIIVMDLKNALQNIYELTGQSFDEQVLDSIFREFCLGK